MTGRRFRTLFATLGLTALACVPSAQAQDRTVPRGGAELKLSFAPVVKRATPAVVNVYAARTVEVRNPLFDDPMFRRFFGAPGNIPREQMQRSLGSGVIVDTGGLIITNNHVVEGATEVKVSLADKREFEAEIVLKDARTDLAILRIKDAKERFPAIEFGNSDELQVGDLVLAIGNPFGVGQTVTHGIVSALARTQVGITDYQFFIQTDAAINPGQFRRCAGRPVRAAGRHQHRDLLALRRLAGHRLCDSGRHGAGCGRLGARRRQRRETSVARRQAAKRDAGDCRRPGTEAQFRCFGRGRERQFACGKGRYQDRRRDHFDRGAGRR